MAHIFTWQNLWFVLPLAAGILLVFGAAFGIVGLDSDVEVDVESDVGSEASEPAGAPGGSSAWSLLGVGRVPLSIILMIALTVFGGVGLCMNLILARVMSSPWWIGTVSAALSFVVTILATGTLSRLIARFMPTTETYATSKHDLLGCSGTAELEIMADFGVANVHDHTGTLHKVRCRSDSERISKGSAVLLIDYDGDRDEYLVEKSPI